MPPPIIQFLIVASTIIVEASELPIFPTPLRDLGFAKKEAPPTRGGLPYPTPLVKLIATTKKIATY